MKESLSKPTDLSWRLLDGDLHFHTLNHDYAPVGLLEMIPSPPREVLDVGCFCGGTGRWLRHRFLEVKIIGIEMSEQAVTLARPSYDDLHVGKFEEIITTIPSWLGRFDTIIAADVLEHMYHPWQALLQLRGILAPGGSLYLSLPNIRNLHVLSELAAGRWRYEGAGILDVSHIRFFTKTQIFEMLTQTGWQAAELRFNNDQRLTPIFAGRDRREIKTIRMGKLCLEGLNPEDIDELLALQFFIRATPVV